MISRKSRAAGQISIKRCFGPGPARSDSAFLLNPSFCRFFLRRDVGGEQGRREVGERLSRLLTEGLPKSIFYLGLFVLNSRLNISFDSQWKAGRKQTYRVS